MICQWVVIIFPILESSQSFVRDANNLWGAAGVLTQDLDACRARWGRRSWLIDPLPWEFHAKITNDNRIVQDHTGSTESLSATAPQHATTSNKRMVPVCASSSCSSFRGCCDMLWSCLICEMRFSDKRSLRSRGMSSRGSKCSAVEMFTSKKGRKTSAVWLSSYYLLIIFWLSSDYLLIIFW
jgi:hypothetical protein